MAAGFGAAAAAMLWTRRYGAAALFVLAIVESYVGLRYPFHDAVRDALLGGGHENGAKTALQKGMLLGAGVAGSGVIILALPWFARLRWERQLVAAGGVLIAATLGVELISLHTVDAILYHPIGPFALCALIYFAGSLMVGGGALVQRSRQDGPSVLPR